MVKSTMVTLSRSAVTAPLAAILAMLLPMAAQGQPAGRNAGFTIESAACPYKIELPGKPGELSMTAFHEFYAQWSSEDGETVAAIICFEIKDDVQAMAEWHMSFWTDDEKVSWKKAGDALVGEVDAVSKDGHVIHAKGYFTAKTGQIVLATTPKDPARYDKRIEKIVQQTEKMGGIFSSDLYQDAQQEPDLEKGGLSLYRTSEEKLSENCFHDIDFPYPPVIGSREGIRRAFLEIGSTILGAYCLKGNTVEINRENAWLTLQSLLGGVSVNASEMNLRQTSAGVIGELKTNGATFRGEKYSVHGVVEMRKGQSQAITVIRPQGTAPRPEIDRFAEQITRAAAGSPQ